jgi:hypothetical protein
MLSYRPHGPGELLEQAMQTHIASPGNPTQRLTIYHPAYHPWGCSHGGTRNSSTSRRVHTRLGTPAAIAGIPGRHGVAEPVPLMGRGWGRGWRQLACGRHKV